MVAAHTQPFIWKASSIPRSRQNSPILLHRLLGAPRERERRLGAAERDQVLEVRPPGQREAAVAAAGAGAADVGLDQRDVGAGGAALELERGPQTGEAAADDADVGLGVALEARVLVRLAALERLLQPERAAAVGLYATACERR